MVTMETDQLPMREFRLFFRESTPEGAVKHNLLLLHDDESRDCWSSRGVLESLASHGHRAVSVDVPESDEFEEDGVRNADRQRRLVDAIMTEMGLTRTRTVVMGDGRSAPYLMSHMLTSEDSVGPVLGYVFVRSPPLDQWEQSIDRSLAPAPILLLLEETESSEASRNYATRRDNMKLINIGESTSHTDKPREIMTRAILSFLNNLESVSNGSDDVGRR